MNKLLETTQKFPQTEVWNDSCSCKELSYAVENGASGATTNPVIVYNVLKKELPEWEDTIRQIADDHSSCTEDPAIRNMTISGDGIRLWTQSTAQRSFPPSTPWPDSVTASRTRRFYTATEGF